MEIPMWIFAFILCFHFTFARPPNKKPCKNDGEKKFELNAEDQFLQELGIVNRPKTASDWRAAFVAALHKYVAAKKDNKALFFQILLGSREEIKVLERVLFPLTGFPNPSSRYSRWMIIFLTLPNHPTVAALIKLINREKFTLDEFAREAQRFYGDDSSAIHGVRLPDISVQEMKDILAANGRKPYPHELRLLTVIVEGGDMIMKTYNSSKNETSAEEDVVEPRCIKLGKLNLPASEYEKKIKTYFFKNAENIESVTHMTRQWGQGFYQITFNTVKNALRGFLKHAVMLGETSPKIFLTDCNATTPRVFDSNLANIEHFD